jgi:hypothetical protein
MDRDFDNERQQELNERIVGEINMMSQEATANLKKSFSKDMTSVCCDFQD